MMRDRMLVRFALLAALALTSAPAGAQSKPQPPPRTPDGKPSLEGTFSFSTITPMQRPEALAGKEVLTDAEAAAFEKAENTRLNRDLFDPERGAPTAGYPSRADGGVLSYNEFWYERGDRMTSDRRTSLVFDPPNGRIPMNAATRQKNAENGKRMYAGFAENPEDRTLADRCLVGFNAGPPMTPGAYNNNLQIVQTATHVVILNEMVHTARIIPIDGRPHSALRKWTGDSRGRWEGDTLVVETKNFLRATSLAGSTPDTHLIERFRRVDADTIEYQFTVTDPNSFTQPWSAKFPLWRTDDPVYEYACHEGNYAMPAILKGQRLLEQEGR